LKQVLSSVSRGTEGLLEKTFKQNPKAQKVVSKGVVGLALQQEETGHRL
jgi:hypothetical protein